MRRLLLISACLVLTMAGCGDDAPTVSEYAAEVEQLVAGMEVSFKAIDEEWESQPPSIDRAREYWDSRLRIRYDFLESITALRVPESVAEMHQSSLDVFSRITAADVALQERVASLDSITEHWQWTDTPEGRAADAVLEEVFGFCRASQDEFDATKERALFDDAAWLPAEMREVVRVAFGCPPQDG